MEEKQIETMMLGAHRWMFYCWNFQTQRHTDGMYYPTVIMQAAWTCSRDHICAKYMHSLDKVGSQFALMDLYGELDNNNRRAMLDWIMNNENHATKL